MDNTRSTKNYAAHGGSEWVIGGRLTFLPGATVEGRECFLGAVPCEKTKSPYVPDSKATSTAALRDDLNKLLAALRAAGLLPAEETEADKKNNDEMQEQDDGG